MTTPSRNFPFRRNTAVSPIMIPATDEPSQMAVGPLPSGVTSFGVVNAFPVYMRLVGSSEASGFVPAEDWMGWCIPPGHFGIYSTQFPKWVSCLAVARPGYPIYDAEGDLLYPEAKLELFYGSGA